MLTCQRSLFQIPADEHYLNGAYMSPISLAVEAAGVAGAARKRSPWTITADDFFTEANRARALFARLVNAPDPSRIAIIPAASYGLAIAARNLPAARGQNLVVTHEQFPANVHAWRRLATAARRRDARGAAARDDRGSRPGLERPGARGHRPSDGDRRHRPRPLDRRDALRPRGHRRRGPPGGRRAGRGRDAVAGRDAVRRRPHPAGCADCRHLQVADGPVLDGLRLPRAAIRRRRAARGDVDRPRRQRELQGTGALPRRLPARRRSATTSGSGPTSR